MQENLKQKTANSLFWTFVGMGLGQIINVVFGILLARMLSIEDYGIVGVLNIFCAVATYLQEGGFTWAIGNKKDVTFSDYNSVFWFSLCVGIFLYLILFSCSGLIANFYNMPELEKLSKFVFLNFVASSTLTSQSAYYYKNLLTKQRSIANILGIILSGIIALIWALNGGGYWALACQNVAYLSIYSLFLWIFSPFRPKFQFTFEPIKKLLPISSKLMITNVFNLAVNNIFSTFLGRFYTKQEVGIYNQGYKWMDYFQFTLSGTITGVTLPILREASNEQERLVRVFTKLLRFISFLSFPCLIGLSHISYEFIEITIGSKWLDSANILSILCLAGTFLPMINLFQQLIINCGKSQYFMYGVVIRGVVLILSLFVIYPYGLEAMAYFFVIYTILWVVIWLIVCKRLINFSIKSIFMSILPYIATIFISILASHYISIFVENIYLRILQKIIVVGILYLGILKCFNPEIIDESLQYFKKKKK